MKDRSYSRKAIIFTLFTVYAFALIKPVLPVFKDLIAHSLFSAGHQASVHFENGEYHLHVELLVEADKKNDDQNENRPGTNETLAQHLFSEATSYNDHTGISQLKFPPLVLQLTAVCIRSTNPPPEA